MAATLSATNLRAASTAPSVAPFERQAGMELSRAPVVKWTALAVENMNCGGCMRRVERALTGVPGIASARANLSQKRVTVAHEPAGIDVAAMVALLAANGYRAAELVDEGDDVAVAEERDLLRRLAVAGFAAANIMLLSVAVWAGLASDMGAEVQSLFHWLSAIIAIPAVAYAGWPFFTSAATVLGARSVNMDVPISLGVLLATAMSLVQSIRGTHHVYFDAAVTLVFFLLIGRCLDRAVRRRSSGAAQNLLGLKATTATVIDQDGRTERVAARVIQPGMRILVAAGERIAADGRIVSGVGDIDEQLITGESVPRRVAVGDIVHAGTVSLTGPLEIEAATGDDDTLIAEIGRLMQAAEQGKGRYVRLADRAAALYAPMVHGLSLATLVGWLATGAGFEQALTTAIAVLIITCPCALALAVPAVQVAAIGRLFAQGVIVTAADGLERLAEVDRVVLDKTGTLTLGAPRVVEADAPSDETLVAAGRLAAASRHPYANAVAAELARRGLPVETASDVVETAGCGLERSTSGERLGSAAWVGFDESGGDGEAASLWYRAGQDAAPIAIRLEDALRPDAAEVVATLERAGLGVELLSGDRPAAVRAAAAAAGVSEWRAAQRPDAKIARLAELKAAGHKVLMVGDGLNDAPALAAAHASLSMAGAAAAAQLASDGIVQGQRLAPLVETLRVARKAHRLALQNFAIALAYNAVFVPVAAAGLVTPLIAAIAMSASSIVVTANAMRLGRGRKQSRSPARGE